VRGYTDAVGTGGKASIWCSGAWNYEFTNASATMPDNSTAIAGSIVAPAFDDTGAGNDGTDANKNKGD
jgi:hypothetical protein